MNDHLLRRHAPISEAGWGQIDGEAKERLEPHLAARRLVDWSGPHGWEHPATNIGRAASLDGLPAGAQAEGAEARQRRMLPLVEFRVPFAVSLSELFDADRGAVDLELDDLDRAAREAATVENLAVFHGWSAAGIVGITEASSHKSIPLGEDPADYPASITRAVETVRQAGIDGPYGLAIGPDGYARVAETTEHGGYLLADHLRRILGGGKIVRAPGLDGAVVASLAGGDFLFEVGQDLAVGYSRHDGTTAHLYLEESFSFRVAEPDAAIALTA